MAKISHIRGVILEEVLLYLLKYSGFRTVTRGSVQNDQTLCIGNNGIQVKGRGGDHQIDAIADFCIAIPFSNPQRLLVEAKCYQQDTIGIDILRNAVGVIDDVNEYWTSVFENNGRRYHYRYAIFSASNFTNVAERYAFAHDIYLFPLQNSIFFRPIIYNIFNIDHRHFNADDDNSIDISLRVFRLWFRSLLNNQEPQNSNININQFMFGELINQTRRINGVILGMIGGQFPIIMTPNLDFNLDNLENDYEVQMFGDYTSPDGWILKHGDREILSFDIPISIFKEYEQNGRLNRNNAISMKTRYFSEIQSLIMVNEIPQIVTFHLDKDWLRDILRQIRISPK